MSTRRKWMAAGAGLIGAGVAARLAQQYGLVPPDQGGLYGPGTTLTYAAHRLLTSDAREFDKSQITTPFANGRPPREEAFKIHQAAGFADWRLEVRGMVERPGSFALAELKSYPSRTQITHLACEEGWSFIAEWVGVPLAHILQRVGVLPGAKYVVYHSIQPRRWDSIDMDEAMHSQTLVTYGMNGGDLPVGHGGPLRMRVPRQLGYKNIKFLTGLTLTNDLSKFGKGLGSSSPEAGYAWYAGI